MDTDPATIKTDPLTPTEEAANVGTDVSIGPGETIPEAEGKRRPGTFGNEPERAPVPGVTPGGNPDNPGDDPGVAPRPTARSRRGAASRARTSAKPKRDR